MSIKSLDFQVLLPKSQEVAKQLQNMRQNAPVDQQHLSQQAQKKQAEERSKIAETVKSEQRKVKEKYNQEQEGKNKQEMSQQKKEKSKDKRLGKVKSLGGQIDVFV